MTVNQNFGHCGVEDLKTARIKPWPTCQNPGVRSGIEAADKQRNRESSGPMLGHWEEARLFEKQHEREEGCSCLSHVNNHGNTQILPVGSISVDIFQISGIKKERYT